MIHSDRRSDVARRLDEIVAVLAVERFGVEPEQIDACRDAQRDLAGQGMEFWLPELLRRREILGSTQINDLLGLLRAKYLVCPGCAEVHEAAEIVKKGVCPACGAELHDASLSPFASTYFAAAARSGASASVFNLAVGQGPFGDFEIVREIGRGGMGVVYEARQMDLDRRVALKVLLGHLTEDAEVQGRFRREAESVARLKHPGVVKVYSCGVQDGLPYISMEYVEGMTLERLVARGALTPRRAVEIAARVAEALEAAHKEGVLHRDVKPSNVIVTPDDRVKLMDFGLARHAGDRTLTRTGFAAGTPAYMSPEQAIGDKDRLGPRSDVYMLGATLYECLTGVKPFQGDTNEGIMMAVVHKEPVPPRKVRPTLSPDLEAIVLKTMEKEPHRRYPSAAALAADLQAFLDGKGVAARPVSMIGRIRRKARRHPVMTAIIAASAAAVLGLGTWAAAIQIERAQERAERVVRGVEDAATAFAQVERWAAAHDERLAALEKLYKEIEPGRKSLSREKAERMAEVGEARRSAEESAVKIEASLRRVRELAAQVLLDDPDRSEVRELERSALDLTARAYLRFADVEAAEWDERVHGAVRLLYARAAFYGDAEVLRRAKGDGSLTAASDPPGAEVFIREVDPNTLAEGSETSLGPSPQPVAMGSHVLKFRLEGYADAIVPVLIERNEDESVRVRMVRPGEIPKGMVYVAGGTGIIGDRWMDWAQKKEVKPFFIDRTEVTFAEYWDFLESLPETEAEKRLPRLRGMRFELPPDLEKKPVVAISLQDMEVYSHWAGKRLPTREEWEFAARGADGREFPWGNKFVSAYCNSQDRWSGRPSVPLSEYLDDADSGGGASPFGCLHMSGNVGEPVRVGDEWFTMGGNFSLSNSYCRIGVVFGFGGPSMTTGFRCVRDVPR